MSWTQSSVLTIRINENSSNSFSNLFLFSVIKNLLRDHNVNTSFFKHVLCHPTNNKKVFHLCQYSKDHKCC